MRVVPAPLAVLLNISLLSLPLFAGEESVDDVAGQQRDLGKRIEKLEQTMERIASILAKQNPEQAAKLRSAWPPTGGSALTVRLAHSLEKPLLALDLERSTTDEAIARLRTWLAEAHPRVLNVAGPRLSQEPRIAEVTAMILRGAIRPAVA